MTPERYRSILVEYDTLIEQAKAISAHLTGRPIDEKHTPYVDTLFTKLVCHGISLRKLSPGADVHSPGEIWDLPSACAVSRALIETYDAMGYIGTPDISSLERQFRLLVWEQHDQKRRLAMLERIGSVDSRVEAIRTKSETLKADIEGHAFFACLSNSAKNRVSRSEACHLTQRELNAANGINHPYYESATMYLSQYVHSFPLSLHQLMHLRAGEPEAIQLSSLPLQYAEAFIAKGIDTMLKIWPDCKTVVQKQHQSLIERWILIASKGVAQF